MELHRFFEGIRMMPEAVRQVGRLHIEERTYQRIKALFQRDKKKFYTTVLRQPDFRICFLYYFSRMGCETYERYQEDGIGERIYWDTFYDLTLWCENCFREYGAYGTDQYDWFFAISSAGCFGLDAWSLKGWNQSGLLNMAGRR